MSVRCKGKGCKAEWTFMGTEYCGPCLEKRGEVPKPIELRRRLIILTPEESDITMAYARSLLASGTVPQSQLLRRVVEFAVDLAGKREGGDAKIGLVQ